MKKMPCLFVRDFTDKRRPVITREVTPGCEWALEGDWRSSGPQTVSRKRDGTACAVIGGKLHGRYDAKAGKTPPPGCIPCCEADPITGHHPHWEPVEDQPKFKWHREAWDALTAPLADGTYELCGPKLQTNPEGFDTHRFVRHGDENVGALPLVRTFDVLRDFLRDYPGEGVVFAHSDGRMCKIRRTDFGYAWPIPKPIVGEREEYDGYGVTVGS